jgi:predicted RNA-binding protein with PIN domain
MNDDACALQRGNSRSFLAGAGETLAIVASFVSAGLLAGGLAAAGRPAPPGAEADLSYIPEMADEVPEPRVWLVDGFNALHVAVLRGRAREGWWTREGREQLLARVRGFDDRSAEVWVVFDGPHPASEAEATAESGPRVAFAASADAWLLRRVREAPAGEVAVVTADRPLAARVRARGALVVSPRDFLARCGGTMPEEG